MKELRIFLENCDSITIDSQHIQFLDMEHINKVSPDVNIICQTTRQLCTADRVTLILSKNANLPHREFGIFDETTVFKRLMKRRDIVSLTVVYEDGKEVTYYVSYDEFEHGFDNKLQTTELDDNGNLVIKIGDFNE